MHQADIWLAETSGTKSRPVLVVSRSSSIPVRTNVVVAPITRSARQLSTQLTVGPENGVRYNSVASFDNLLTVPKADLTIRIGRLGVGGTDRICRALEAMADC